MRVNIQTNSSTTNDVTLGSNVQVFGQVSVGGVYADVVDLGTDAQIYGGAGEPLTEVYTPVPVVLPAGSPAGDPFETPSEIIEVTLALNDCACSSIVVKSGTTLNITGSGALHLTKLQVDGDAIINFLGDDVTLVVDTLTTGGQAAFSSLGKRMQIYGTGEGDGLTTGIVNFAQNSLSSSQANPLDMKIFVKGTNPVAIRPSGAFYAVIYAPDAAVTLDAPDGLYGSIVARTLVIEANSAIHYDDALAGASVQDAEDAPYVIDSWRQL